MQELRRLIVVLVCVAIAHALPALPAAANEAAAAKLLLRGQQALARGDADGAAWELDAARRQAVAESDPHTEALALVGQANVFLGRGDRDGASQLLDLALRQARANGLPDVENNVLVNRGVLLSLAGRPGAAAKSLRMAFDRAVSWPSLRLQAAIYLARIAMRSGDRDEAERWMGAAMEVHGQLPRDEAWTGPSLALSKLLLDAAAHDARNEALLIDAAQMARQAGDMRGESHARGYLGQLLGRLDRRDEAFSQTRQAIFLAETGAYPELLYQWQWSLGRLERQSERPERAVLRYREAIATLTPVRMKMPAVDPASGDPVFRRKVGPLYSELADLLLRGADAAGDDGERQRRLEDVRDVMEQFKTAELEDYLHSPCAIAVEGEAGLLHPAPGTAIFYPIILEDRLELLLQTPAGLSHHAVAVDAATFRREVLGFRHSLENYSLGDQALDEGRRLYDRLIRPIEAELTGAGIHTLLFLPDDVLRLVPLSALSDGQRFVLDWLAVGVVPGLRMTSRSGHGARGQSVLLAGLGKPVNGFPALPGVAQEIAAVSAIYPADILLDDHFIPSNVARGIRSGNFSIMHFSSHAVFRGDPRNSYILTYGGRLTLDELERFVRDGAGKGHKIDLLTLSACETAAGDDRSALGLAGAAVKGGVRSVFGSLWPIADAAASSLLPEFYRALKDDGISKVEALRRAQMVLRTNPEFAHPSLWSPFVIVGDWQ
ncbi:MAG: CHAT domain-containing protein [Magnetococcales bacterium]|nr:CHAT domain-containing protein [Magnetococcales bacterium]